MIVGKVRIVGRKVVLTIAVIVECASRKLESARAMKATSEQVVNTRNAV